MIPAYRRPIWTSLSRNNGFEVNLRQIKNTNPSTINLNRTLGLAIP